MRVLCGRMRPELFDCLVMIDDGNDVCDESAVAWGGKVAVCAQHQRARHLKY